MDPVQQMPVSIVVPPGDQKRPKKVIILASVCFLLVAVLIVVFFVKKALFKTNTVFQVKMNGSITSVPKLTPTPRLYAKQIFIKNKELYSYDEKNMSFRKLGDGSKIDNFVVDFDKKDTVSYLHNGEIMQMNLSTGTITQITHTNSTIDSFRYAPDRSLLVVETKNRSMPTIVSADGSKVQLVPQPPDSLVGYSDFSIEKWLPDSKHFIIRGHGQLDTTNNFLEVAVTTNTVKKFTAYGDFAIQNMPEINYSPDGKTLLYVPDYQTLYETKNNVVQPQKIFSLGNSNGYVVWSPDSSHIAVTVNRGHDKGDSIVVIDPKGTVLYETARGALGTGYTNLIWSDDGRYIAAKRYAGYGEKIADTIVLIDIVNKKLQSIVPAIEKPAMESIQQLSFSSSDDLYYVLDETDSTLNDQTLPQLWVWDISHRIGKKVSDQAQLSIYEKEE